MSNHLNQILDGIEQGLVSQDEMQSLQKAITAGYGGAGKPTDLTYGGVIQSESLESTLKSVTFDMKNLKMWPAISIDKAYNLFEQYNRLIGYGSDASPYIGEGGAPQEEDSTYVRDGKKIVFFGTRRKVSHQMTLVRTTVGDVVAQQAKEGTMHLLKHIERELYWGQSHFTAAATGAQTGANSDVHASSIALSGLLQQLLAGDDDAQQKSGDFEGYGDFKSIGQDLGGNVITQDDIEELAVIALENFGSPSQLHMEPSAISAFVKQFYPQFRSQPGLASQTVGYDVNKVTTTAGAVDFKPNLFLRPKDAARAAAVNTNAPAAPASAAATTGTTAGTLTNGGVYQYKVTAVNDFGEGAPLQATITSNPDANGTHILTVTAAGAKYINVYQSTDGGAAGTERFIGRYKYTGAGMTAVVAGAKDPGLGEAFLLDMSAECMRFKQLAPLSKINFAIVSTALEFAVVLYGALFVYTPRFNGFFKNVGK
jgi:hypothetical protein